jgi:pyridinium-3,5-biscarboxylic acid mononucleotide sulfurtransferase
MKTAREIVGKSFPHISEFLRQKLTDLIAIIQKHQSAIVGFSGGVDSTFLAWAAGQALEGKALLVTAVSATYPEFELDEAKEIAAFLNLPHKIITTHEIENEKYASNPPDRCFFCKKELFGQILALAKKEGYDTAFEGGNADDLNDIRPGRRALKELNISSPLCEANLTKTEIRQLSSILKLPTSSKPSYACLASRFPYGEMITEDKLKRVEKAETVIRSLGFTQFRVRSHGNLARVELLPHEMEKGWEYREDLMKACKNAGFTYSCIDIMGYRTGAMNEALKTKG